MSLSVGSGHATSVTNSDSKVDLATFWNTAEWGVYGDGGGSEANFGSSTTLQAQTALTATSNAAPTCVKEGFTGETNNLNLTTHAGAGKRAIAHDGNQTDQRHQRKRELRCQSLK